MKILSATHFSTLSYVISQKLERIRSETAEKSWNKNSVSPEKIPALPTSRHLHKRVVRHWCQPSNGEETRPLRPHYDERPTLPQRRFAPKKSVPISAVSAVRDVTARHDDVMTGLGNYENLQETGQALNEELALDEKLQKNASALDAMLKY